MTNLEAAISAVITCAPATHCPNEAACFTLARYVRDHLRQASAVASPPPVEPIMDPDEIPDYAPRLLDARIGGWEAA